MLSPSLLTLLREYYREARPSGWLFPVAWQAMLASLRRGAGQGQSDFNEAGEQGIRAGLQLCRHQKEGLAPHVAAQFCDPSPGRRHPLSGHCYAMPCRAMDIRVIQVLLGHAKLDSTAVYTKVATKTIQSVTSPLDLLGRPGSEPD
jgi:integrase